MFIEYSCYMSGNKTYIDSDKINVLYSSFFRVVGVLHPFNPDTFHAIYSTARVDNNLLSPGTRTP